MLIASSSSRSAYVHPIQPSDVYCMALPLCICITCWLFAATGRAAGGSFNQCSSEYIASKYLGRYMVHRYHIYLPIDHTYEN